MQQYSDFVADAQGNAQPGVKVSVYDSTGALASLYASDGVTALANPLTTDSKGVYSFKAANGTYTVSAPTAGSRAITLFDPQDGLYIDSTKQFLNRNALITTTRDVVDPSGIVPNFWQLAIGNGDNATFRGVSGGYIQAADRSTITSGQRGVLYGLQLTVAPRFDRSNFPYDDADCLVVQNGGTGRGTEAIYFGHNASLTQGDFLACLGMDMWASVALYTSGHYNYGWDAVWGGNPATFNNGLIRAPNNTPILLARNAANTADLSVVGTNNSDQPTLGGERVITRNVNGWTPTISADSGAYTTVSVQAARWSQINRMVSFQITVQLTTKGTAAGALVFTLPVTAPQGAIGSGVNASDGKVLTCTASTGGSTMRCTNYDGSDPLVNGKFYTITGTYEAAS